MQDLTPIYALLGEWPSRTKPRERAADHVGCVARTNFPHRLPTGHPIDYLLLQPDIGIDDDANTLSTWS